MKIDKKTKEEMSRIVHMYAPVFLTSYAIIAASETHRKQIEALNDPYISIYKKHEEFKNRVFDNVHDDDLEELLENNYI